MFRLVFSLVLISVTQVLAAQTHNKAQAELLLNGDKGVEVQLEVRQMPLTQVLASIINKTKIPIHYSVLPEGLVTATCVGSSLKQVLECLLDHKADLIVRNQNDSNTENTPDQIAEAWILGSKLGGVVAKVECPATIDKGSLKLQQHDPDSDTNPDRTEALLKAAQSKNPEERAQAMGGFIAGGRKGDAAIKAALEQGLTDQNEMVRAQAISSFSRREGSGATTALQEALRDPSVQVRIMAVDGIFDDKALLQQAINDSDETVRNMAIAKLEALTQINKNAP